MMALVGIVDTHVCNLQSIYNATQLTGAKSLVVHSPEQFKACTHIIIPGVGSFSKGIEQFENYQLRDALLDHIAAKRPTLGICLGMHLLADSGDEFGTHKGLGVVKATVMRLTQNENVTLPHMGWNEIQHQGSELFSGIPQNSQFYFAHSYVLEPKNKQLICASCQYQDIEFTASIQYDNVFAVQFHPEKSHDIGLKLLNNFVTLC